MDLNRRTHMSIINIDSQGCGIYSIVCTSTNDRYIGASANYFSRVGQHLSELRNNLSTVCRKELQLLWNKEGPQNFKIEILENCAPQFLLIKEKKWIRKLNPSLNINRETFAANPSWIAQETKEPD